MVCGGYWQRHPFVNSTVQDTTNSGDERFSQMRYSKAKYVEAANRRLAERDMSDSKLLNGTVYELKYVDVFWEMYLPDSRNFTPEARQYSIAGWALLAQKWVHYDGALKLALGAISLNTIGQELGKKWMIQEGRKLYGAALQGMASSVQNLHRKNQNAIIMTSRILSLFEVRYIQLNINVSRPMSPLNPKE